jgi:hypothetical protein
MSNKKGGPNKGNNNNSHGHREIPLKSGFGGLGPAAGGFNKGGPPPKSIRRNAARGR